ncbi:iron-containing alcohol dehydrogenase family protein [Candidatus Pacearchaeota archaeon]|nr:iron-containing alcohol dehydrogenase family protein [Candidatus Pacearchaeota archaeon]
MIDNNLEIPEIFIIEKNIINRLGCYLKERNISYTNIALITNEQLIKKIGVQNIGLDKFEIIFAESNSIDDAEKVISKLDGKDLVIGMGGGKILDIGKYAAFKKDIRFISIPTALSHDGIYSPITVISINNKTISFCTKIPLGIIVDMNILMNCPKELIISGIGDIVSSYSALYDWKLSNIKTNEAINDISVSMSQTAFELIENICQKDVDVYSEDFLKILTKALMLRGMAMNIAGSSRPSSGSEHQFSHAIDQLFNKNSHGFQVGVGTIISAFIQGRDYNKIKQILMNVGAPTSIQELGLTIEQASDALIKAPETRNRYTILNETNMCKENLTNLLKQLF